MEPLKSLAGFLRVRPACLSGPVLCGTGSGPLAGQALHLLQAPQWQRFNLADSLSLWLLSQKQVAVGKGAPRELLWAAQMGGQRFPYSEVIMEG